MAKLVTSQPPLCWDISAQSHRDYVLTLWLKKKVENEEGEERWTLVMKIKAGTTEGRNKVRV